MPDTHRPDDLAALAAEVAAREAALPLRAPEVAARIDFADGPEQTDVALVYIPGFSATPREVHPVPEKVCADLGMNAYFARLDGQGLDGTAMGKATLDNWRRETREALEIGRRLGRRVVAMGCSTGCTLMALEAQDVAAQIHVAPNFALKSPLTELILGAPGVRHWGRFVAGRERILEPISDEHDRFWTLRYPIEAVLPMFEAVRAVRAKGLADMTMPAFFAWSPQDTVVRPSAIEKAVKAWPGPVETAIYDKTADDVEECHVIAGDVFAPHRTDELAARIVDWLKRTL